MADNSLIVNGQYNIGHICTAQQCANGHSEAVAMRFITPKLVRTDFTFRDLDQQSNRFANAIESLGFQAGDTFFTFLPKTPELFMAILGALKARVIVGTLFSNFGEDALLDRVGDARAKGIITKRSLLPKIQAIRGKLPYLEHVIVIDGGDDLQERICRLDLLMDGVDVRYDTASTSPDTPSLVHYTSGSTGKPKGVLHRHGSVVTQSATVGEIFSLTSSDRFWCTADQGWVTGTSYGIIGPWSLGVSQVHYAGGYDPEAWFTILQEERITTWYTAPTALRMLMQQPEDFYRRFDLSSLRTIFSVGEPLNPEVITWAKRVLCRQIYDTWFQTETGAIMISNRPAVPVRPGSMGMPVSGIMPAIIGDDGTLLDDGMPGNLCLRTSWPSLFCTYLNNPDVYASKFRNGFYYTGDSAYRDKDGYFWFQGRCDDIINTAGHLVSPFEVESALIEVDEVAESGVVGVPDDILYEKVIAFVRLRDGFSSSPQLELKVRLWVTQRVSSMATPQEIIFTGSIPKNQSGKIMRRILKARYSGEDLGDTSTMEI